MTFWLMLLTSLLSEAVMHPMHVSLSEVTYAAESSSLQITHKLFLDDLELQMESEARSRGKEISLRFNTPKENPAAETYLQAYIREHFRLWVDGKEVVGNYLGKEYEINAVWVYIEVPDITKPKKVDLADTFLLDVYDDQSNIVNFFVGKDRKSLRFHRGMQRQQLAFQ
ncbi:MAG: hypothetical protein H6555_01780 [Lewinellaceae bacterium]|nr:hypothetical protein [Lewinellaceae bacterium]